MYCYCSLRSCALRVPNISSVLSAYSSVNPVTLSRLLHTQIRFPQFTLASRQMSSKANFGYQNSRVVEKLRQLDNVPKHYELIYRSAFPNYMIAVQAFNLITFGALTVVVIINFLTSSANSSNLDKNSKRDEVGMTEVEDSHSAASPAQPQLLQEKLKQNFGFSESDNADRENHGLPKPSFDEVIQGGLETYILFTAMLLMFTISFVRLQRRLPIRIYTSQSGHSVGVFYGHFIPGVRTRREFVAGTLTSLANPRGILWNAALYQDGSGNKMVLMEHSFRYPSDFNRLMETDDEDNNSHGQNEPTTKDKRAKR